MAARWQSATGQGLVLPEADWMLIVEGQDIAPDGDPFIPQTRYDDTTPLPCEDLVIVAIIDDGIAVANERFRLPEGGTRIEYFTDLRVPDRATGQKWLDYGDAPIPDFGGTVFNNGVQWTRAQIGDLMSRFDEPGMYTAMGMIDPRRSRRQPLKFQRTHGTHVLDIAAGCDLHDGDQVAAARARPIIAVQLPSETIADRSGAVMAKWLETALQRVAHDAKALAERQAAQRGGQATPLPIVVNLSFGAFAGPHDGSSGIEQAIEKFVADYRSQPGAPACDVILPAGNGFMSRSFAELKAGDLPYDFEWRVLPDDFTPSFIHFWREASSPGDSISVEVVPPNHCAGVRSTKGEQLSWVADNEPLARVYHDQRSLIDGGTEWERVVVAIRASAPASGKAPAAPDGVWTLKVSNNGAPADAVIAVRVQRDDAFDFMARPGRQSFLEYGASAAYDAEPGIEPQGASDPDGPVTSAGTMNSYAAGDGVVVVGGYVEANGKPARYTSAGSDSVGPAGPHLSATCEATPSHSGILSTGTYSGTCFAMNGTSVSAPAVARWLADRFAEPSKPKSFAAVSASAKVDAAEGSHGEYGSLAPSRHGDFRLGPVEHAGRARHIER